MTDLRWRAWFQRSGEPIFVLNRHRRILFVNRAWEKLTGVSAERARQLACRRPRAGDDEGWEKILEHALRPPEEALEGRAARARRRVPHADPARRWWDVDFLPFRGDDGLLFLLGRITVASASAGLPPPPLPDAAVALREANLRRHDLESLASDLPSMRRVAEQVRLAARVRLPALFVGERGVGKTWAARVVHALSPARTRPFVALDCARLPPAVVAGLLFGDGEAERGFEPGTLYLREPSRLPRELQLRVCHLLASEESEERGPRLLAACRADPADEVRAGRLLEELACRLSPITVAVPPLRERREDLPRLVEPLLERASAVNARHIAGLTPAAWDAIRAYAWPGNLSELYRVLVSGTARTDGETIDAADLPLYLRLERRATAPERSLPLKTLLEEAERRLIALALRKSAGNKSRAADLLSVWRPLLLRRMEALGLAEPNPKSKRRTADPEA